MNIFQYYVLTKNRPSIVPLVVPILPMMSKLSKLDSLYDRILGSDSVSITNVNTLRLPTSKVITSSCRHDIMAEANVDEVKLRDIVFDISSTNNGTEIYGAKIEGGYSDYLDLMVNKHLSNSRKLGGNIIVLDSYDGAEHHGRNKTSIVSFNSHIFSETTVRSGASPAESFNILTW